MARVMIVDDTEHVREMLATMLDLDGFEVVATAANGEEALERVTATNPDVMVLDYKMPGMDGLSVTRKLRRSNISLPVILYSAYVDAKLLDAAAEAGVSLCVGKTEGIHTLERQISALCLELSDTDIR